MHRSINIKQVTHASTCMHYDCHGPDVRPSRDWSRDWSRAYKRAVESSRTSWQNLCQIPRFSFVALRTRPCFVSIGDSPWPSPLGQYRPEGMGSGHDQWWLPQPPLPLALPASTDRFEMIHFWCGLKWIVV